MQLQTSLEISFLTELSSIICKEVKTSILLFVLKQSDGLISQWLG